MRILIYLQVLNKLEITISFYFTETKINGVTNVHNHEDSVDSMSHSSTATNASEHYRLGFQECLSETVHFLIEVEGFFARDSLCVQLINHLQQHCEKILATSTYILKCFPSLVKTYTGKKKIGTFGLYGKHF